jgi:hypothetical protein
MLLSEFKDEDGTPRKPGEQWLITGPKAFCRPAQALARSKVQTCFTLEPFGVYVFRPGYLFLYVAMFVFLIFYRLILPFFSGSGDVPVVTEVEL